MSFDNMETVTWKGVTFEVQGTRDSLVNRLVEHTFPYRKGSKWHNMGRAGRPTDFTAVFMGENYATRFGALMLQVDGGKPGTFQHPFFGSWNAYVQLPDIAADWDSRDMYTVQISVIEEGLDADVEPTFTVETLSDNLTAQGLVITAKQALLTATAMKTQIDASIARVQQKISDAKEAAGATAQEMDRKMNDLRSAVKTSVALIEGNHPPAVAGQMRRAMQVAVYRADQIARAAKVIRPRIISHEQRIEGPAHLLAFQYTGDPDKYLDFLRINRIRNPLRIPAGDRLSVFRQDPDA